MPRSSSKMGLPIKGRPHRQDPNETLRDLDPSYGHGRENEYYDLIHNLRDGANKQRCGGGVRIIRKRTPE